MSEVEFYENPTIVCACGMAAFVWENLPGGRMRISCSNSLCEFYDRAVTIQMKRVDVIEDVEAEVTHE